jgi:hypothetical protein
MTTMTKKQAKARLGVKNDRQLALRLGVRHQAVYAWGGENDPIPRLRQLEIEAMTRRRKSA